MIAKGVPWAAQPSSSRPAAAAVHALAQPLAWALSAWDFFSGRVSNQST